MTSHKKTAFIVWGPQGCGKSIVFKKLPKDTIPIQVDDIVQFKHGKTAIPNQATYWKIRSQPCVDEIQEYLRHLGHETHKNIAFEATGNNVDTDWLTKLSEHFEVKIIIVYVDSEAKLRERLAKREQQSNLIPENYPNAYENNIGTLLHCKAVHSIDIYNNSNNNPNRGEYILTMTQNAHSFSVQTHFTEHTSQAAKDYAENIKKQVEQMHPQLKLKFPLLKSNLLRAR